MPFVNERIDPNSADAELLGLPALMKRFAQRAAIDYYVTIDRERGIMLTKVSQGHWDDPGSHAKQLFYLRSGSDAVTVQIEQLPTLDYPAVHWRMLGMSIEAGSSFDARQVVTILKEALCVFGVLGTPQDPAQHRVTFDF